MIEPERFEPNPVYAHRPLSDEPPVEQVEIEFGVRRSREPVTIEDADSVELAFQDACRDRNDSRRLI